MPYWDRIPRLDRRMALQGVLHNAMTFWTLSTHDATLDTVVLATSDFGADEGKVLLVANAGGRMVYINGNYTAGVVWVGRAMPTPELKLSRFVMRDESGLAVSQGSLTIRDVVVRHHNTGKYTIKVDHQVARRTDRERTFEAASNDIEVSGKTKSFVGAKTEDVDIIIQSPGPKPCTIVSAEAEASWASSTE